MKTLQEAQTALVQAWPAIQNECLGVLGSELLQLHGYCQYITLQPSWPTVATMKALRSRKARVAAVRPAHI